MISMKPRSHLSLGDLLAFILAFFKEMTYVGIRYGVLRFGPQRQYQTHRHSHSLSWILKHNCGHMGNSLPGDGEKQGTGMYGKTYLHMHEKHVQKKYGK